MIKKRKTKYRSGIEDWPIKICEWCKAPYYVWPGAAERSRFCSLKCRNLYHWDKGSYPQKHS